VYKVPGDVSAVKPPSSYEAGTALFFLISRLHCVRLCLKYQEMFILLQCCPKWGRHSPVFLISCLHCVRLCIR